MHKWYKVAKETKVNAYNQIAESTGMSPFAVEKDWWVVQALSIIFELEIGKALVFKGGTSLSKVWGLISRFSEDIDLAVDRSFFGYEGELSKSQRTKLRKDSSEYITESLFPELQEVFKQKELDDIEFKLVEAVSSDQDPRIIEIYYPHVIEAPGYLAPRVQLEIGSRSLIEPFSVQKIKSLVDEHFSSKEFAQKKVSIPTVIPERTFLKKIFLLHEEFHRPPEKIRVDRLSRHLYDVYQISQTKIADSAINDQKLYETIVKHRHRYTKVGGVDYNLHQPQTINPIPLEEFKKSWKKDYQTMQEQMIYGDSPSFEEMIAGIQSLVEKINKLEWVMDNKFPIPNND
ncbi:MAG: nucleotidyl transferase AbiEii/AbiGii toxin family protein [Bacteroidota bacterium]|nr:nucleotidyl transferase AbiEii/AbiGii toxin family protein [Bacteroidota bacterium]